MDLRFQLDITIHILKITRLTTLAGIYLFYGLKLVGFLVVKFKCTQKN
jgi:hypothetical protein